jgi:hypothetical protein
MEARLIGPAFGAPFSEGEKSVRARREIHWKWQDNSFAWACPRKDESRHLRTAPALHASVLFQARTQRKTDPTPEITGNF